MKPPYLDPQGRPRRPNLMELHTPYIRWRRAERRRKWIWSVALGLGTIAAARALYIQESQRPPTKECR